MKNYYIHLDDGKWQKVKGHRVKIEGFEDLDLFWHKEDNCYYISEGKTGMRLIDSGIISLNTAKECAKDLLIRARKNGKLDKVISESIKKYGLSPRYEV